MVGAVVDVGESTREPIDRMRRITSETRFLHSPADHADGFGRQTEQHDWSALQHRNHLPGIAHGLAAVLLRESVVFGGHVLKKEDHESARHTL